MTPKPVTRLFNSGIPDPLKNDGQETKMQQFVMNKMSNSKSNFTITVVI